LAADIERTFDLQWHDMRLVFSTGRKTKQPELKEITMFEVLKSRIATRQRYNRAASELNALSDRDLADMGIHRSDIERIARLASQGSLLMPPV
jgi:uncharacterized protein YjiS (DUF1127 family)